MYKLPTKYPELIQSISPQIDFSGSGTLKIGTNSYRWSNISGVDENYSAMKNYQIAQGRGLQYMDIKDNKQVCVIGDYLNRVAFGSNGLGADAQDRSQQVSHRGRAGGKGERPGHAAGQR